MTDLPPFATSDDLQDSLQRQIPRDTAVGALRRASGAIRGFCHWSISTEVRTNHVVNMRRLSNSLWLPTLWLVSVQAIREGGVTLSASGYAIDSTGRVVRGAGHWNPDLGGLVVDYTHGYPEGDPRLETVVDVCIAAAGRLLVNPLRHASETTGSESWSMGVASAGTTLTDGEKAQLQHLVIEDP